MYTALLGQKADAVIGRENLKPHWLEACRHHMTVGLAEHQNFGKKEAEATTAATTKREQVRWDRGCSNTRLSLMVTHLEP